MKLSCILPFSLSLCVWPPHTLILTHADGVRLTQSPDSPPLGSCAPLIRTPWLWSAKPQCGNNQVCGTPRDPRKKCRARLLSAQLSLRSQGLPVFTLVLCEFFFTGLEAHARVKHSTLVLAGSIFLIPLRC